jgi:hypothetical protein
MSRVASAIAPLGGHAMDHRAVQALDRPRAPAVERNAAAVELDAATSTRLALHDADLLAERTPC